MRAAKELRKLNRMELLEMLVELSEENEKLKAENDDIRAKLDDRAIQLGKTGNIAEASMKLNGVFDAAQRAADQYLENIKRLSGDSEGTGNAIIAQARADAESIRTEAYKQAEAMVGRTKAACAEYTRQQQSVSDLPQTEYAAEAEPEYTPSHAAKTSTKTKKRKGSFSDLF